MLRLNPYKSLLAACILAVLGALASGAAHERITTKITFNKEIVRILEKRCMSCHHTGGSAPMPLTTYTEVRPWAKAIKEEVLERRMPPWEAVAGYGEFSNDPSLSSRDLDLITAWVDGGAPKGEDKDLPKLPDFSRNGVHFSEGPPTAKAGEIAITNNKFEIPPGVSDFPVKASYTLRQNVDALSIQPRMQVLGKSIEVKVVRPDRSLEVLLWIRNYNSDVQRTYTFKRPIPLPRGTRVEVSAYYDNSDNNPRNPHQPPQIVRSPDEICAVYLRVINKQ